MPTQEIAISIVNKPAVRCAKCRRHLFFGLMFGEIKCQCGYVMRFDQPKHVKKLFDAISQLTSVCDGV